MGFANQEAGFLVFLPAFPDWKAACNGKELFQASSVRGNLFVTVHLAASQDVRTNDAILEELLTFAHEQHGARGRALGGAGSGRYFGNSVAWYDLPPAPAGEPAHWRRDFWRVRRDSGGRVLTLQLSLRGPNKGFLDARTPALSSYVAAWATLDEKNPDMQGTFPDYPDHPGPEAVP